MSQTSTKPVEIPKEEVKTVQFSETDILTDSRDVLQRKIDLNRASALGAQSKSNIKIYLAFRSHL